MHVWTRASTYIGIVVVLCAIWSTRAAITLTPLALVACVYGNLDTMLLPQLDAQQRVLSLVGHLLIAGLCLQHRRLTRGGVLLASLVLCAVLVAYRVVGMWPYVISQTNSVVFVATLLLCLYPLAL